MRAHPPTHYCRIHGIILVVSGRANGHHRTPSLVYGNNYVCRQCNGAGMETRNPLDEAPHAQPSDKGGVTD